jgi:pyrrolidone-carboxylate peptidase
MIMMKKFIFRLAILAILACAGFEAYQYAKTKVSEKVVEALNNPSIKQALLKAEQSPTFIAEAKKYAGNSVTDASNTLHFANKQAAVNYATSKLSASEVTRLMYDYANRSNLTQAQKDQDKEEVLSHFSSQELQALAAAASK